DCRLSPGAVALCGPAAARDLGHATFSRDAECAFCASVRTGQTGAPVPDGPDPSPRSALNRQRAATTRPDSGEPTPWTASGRRAKPDLDFPYVHECTRPASSRAAGGDIGVRRIAILTSLLLCAGAAPAATVEVRVEGLDDPLEENVRAFLGLVARSEAQEDPEDEEEELPPLGEGEIRQLHRQAPDEIRQALQPFGYYSPQVDGALERTDDGWVATYRVEPGEPTR